MKGINVRKIAALASGVALLGASVSVAQVMYGNTELVDVNGQPLVKVVVGANAAASDGVAAANIAARIANLAYKSSTLTAEVKGTATCSVGGVTGGGTGGGTCAVTNKKANLEVTLPGVAGGAYQFTTLIADYIDRSPGNRNKTSSDDTYSATVDTSSLFSSLYGDANDTSKIRSTQDVYKISGDVFPAFSPVTLTDTAGGGATYTETQALWVHGETDFSPTLDQVVGKFKGIGYSVKFDSGDYGIVVCSGTNYDTTTNNYASCSSTDSEHIDTHKLEIQFLGQSWVLSEVSVPSGTLDSATSTLFGGSIKLAKASQSGIINVGDELDAGSVKVRLSDISVASGASNLHPAIVDILDANGAVLKQTTINEGSTYTYTAPDGSTVRIKVYKTAPGFTLNAKWADMAILTDELSLKSGERVSTEPSNPNYPWYVYLRWKNKGWTSGLPTGGGTADTLREIILYNGETYSDITAGSGIDIIGKPASYQLMYDGLSLSGTDYDRLKFAIVDSSDIGLVSPGLPNSTVTSNTSCTGATSLSGEKLVKVESQQSNAFKIPGSGGEYVKQFYVRYRPLVNGSGITPAVSVYYKPSNAGCYYWQGKLGDENTTANTTASGAVEYDVAGTGTAQGYLSFLGKPVSSGNLSIYLQEDVGKVNTVTQKHGAFVFDVSGRSNGSFTFTAPNGDNTDAIYYTSPKDSSIDLDPVTRYYDAPVISERGSKFVSLSSDEVIFDVAKKVAEAKYVLKSSGVETANVLKRSLGEGETLEVSGGIKIKVASITETVGSCVAGAVGGATPECTVDSSGVSAVIMPNNAASVEVTEPYRLSSDLVVLDSAAAGVGKKISVGGPLVNTVTREALGNTVDFTTTSVVVKEVGDTIVVAGYTAADTVTAAQQFIAGIRKL
ncbi:MAG: S-layer protein [Candidatus Anstonellales archaeon]